MDGAERNGQETVFLVVHQGFGVRYLLRTDVLRTLVESGLRVVILSPNGGDPDFRRSFEGENVYTESFETAKCEAYQNGSMVQKVMRTIRLYTLNGRYDTRTADNYFRALKETARRTGRPKPWKVALLGAAIRVLKKSRRLRKGFVALEDLLFTPDFHRKLFEKYRPSMVVVSSLGNLDFDRYIMREARRHGAMVTSVILGMDNTSTKGYAGSRPDYVVAWTENMKRELVELHDMDPGRIFVGGVAHFDYYFNGGTVWDRENFCRRLGLDPSKKTIFFATKSPNTCPWSDEVVEMVAGAIENGYFGMPCQMLVRLHPLHWRQRNGQLVFRKVLDGYERLRKKYPFVVFNDPEFDSRNISHDLNDTEFCVLKSILVHSDVMINMFSTLTIEASIFQLPTINICFNGEKRDTGNPLQDLVFDYNESHNRRVMRSRGVRTVFTREELLEQTKRYLEEPRLDREGRDRLRVEECGPYPGCAGAAIGRFTAGLLKSERSEYEEGADYGRSRLHWKPPGGGASGER